MSALKIKVRVLCAVSLVVNMSITMFGLALVYWFRSMYGLSPSAIGLATQIYTATYLAGCLTMPRLTRRFSSPASILVSLLGQAAAIFAFLRVRSLAASYAILGVYGVVLSLLWPSVESWLSAGLEGNALSRATSLFNLSWTFATGVTPWITGVMVASTLTGPFATALSICLVSAFSVFVLARYLKAFEGGPAIDGKEEPEGNPVTTRLYLFGWIGIFLAYTGSTAMQSIFPLYAADRLGISSSYAGFILFLRGIVSFCVFIVLGRISFWQFSRKWTLSGQALLIVPLLLMPLVRQVWSFCVFCVVYGVGFAVNYNASMFHSAAAGGTEAQRKQRLAIHESAISAGQIFGSASAGFLYQHVSFQSAMVLFGLIGLFCLVFESTAGRRIR